VFSTLLTKDGTVLYRNILRLETVLCDVGLCLSKCVEMPWLVGLFFFLCFIFINLNVLWLPISGIKLCNFFGTHSHNYCSSTGGILIRPVQGRGELSRVYVCLSVCLCVCVFVCVCPRANLRNNTLNLQEFFVQVIYRSSAGGVTKSYVLPIVDDVIFARNGPCGGISIPLQRMTSLRRRVQANAPAAWYWLRRVPEDGGRRD